MRDDGCEYLIRYTSHYVTYDGAKQECKRRNSILAVIRSLKEQQAIENIVKRFYSNKEVAAVNFVIVLLY